MSEIHFFLANKNKEKTSVEAIIWLKGVRIKIPVSETVKPAYWNGDKYRCREVREYPDAVDINERLDAWNKLLSDIVYGYNKELIKPTQKHFRERVDKELDKREKQAGINKDAEDIIYFTDFVEELIKTISRSKNTKQKYTTSLLNLKLFESTKNNRLTFDSIDMSFYNDFKVWMDKQDFALNYFGDTIQNIKLFMDEALEKNLHSNMVFRSKKFKSINEETDSIYLTVDELAGIHELEINEDLILNKIGTKVINVKGNIERMITALNDARDRFLIGSFTAMRFGDYSEIKITKFTDDYITKRNKKTGIKTMIPMHWVIREILKKKNNVFPKKISNVKMNKNLKNLGKLASLTELVEISETRGGERVTNTFEKWELITTHTARRSGCTNMYLANIDIKSIMAFSGHKKVSSFMNYIKITQEENAIRLKDHAFFKKPLIEIQDK